MSKKSRIMFSVTRTNAIELRVVQAAGGKSVAAADLGLV
jgi:hypothetical protein